MSRLIRLLIVLLAVTFGSGVPRTTAQPATAGQDAAAEFSTLLQRWREAQDTEQKIVLGERLLALEGEIAAWPAGTDRKSVV